MEIITTLIVRFYESAFLKAVKLIYTYKDLYVAIEDFAITCCVDEKSNKTEAFYVSIKGVYGSDSEESLCNEFTIDTPLTISRRFLTGMFYYMIDIK